MNEPQASDTPYWIELLHCQVREIRGTYRTRIIEAGSGPALILLHGTGGHAENYARNIAALAERFHVIALDFLWHGKSQTEGYDPQIIPPLVDQVVDVMDQLGLASAFVEGQSLGGWVAMQLALRHPERVRALVLTTTDGLRAGRRRDSRLRRAGLGGQPAQLPGGAAQPQLRQRTHAAWRASSPTRRG